MTNLIKLWKSKSLSLAIVTIVGLVGNTAFAGELPSKNDPGHEPLKCLEHIVYKLAEITNPQDFIAVKAHGNKIGYLLEKKFELPRSELHTFVTSVMSQQKENSKKGKSFEDTYGEYPGLVCKKYSEEGDALYKIHGDIK